MYLKIFICVDMCTCAHICVPHVCRCPWRPEKDIISFVTRVTGVCGLLDVGAGN